MMLKITTYFGILLKLAFIFNPVQRLVEAIKISGRVVNKAILIAAATGKLKVQDPAALECNGEKVGLSILKEN